MSPTSGRASTADVGVLLAAAGRGERAGEGPPKQFRPIGGIPMLLRSIRPFAAHPRVRQLVVALPPDVVETPPAWLAELTGERLRLVAGGATRSASVRRALDVLGSGCAIVLVHDAARPFVSRETIDAVIETAAAGHGAVAAIPVTDTLKQVGGTGRRITQTVARGGLWRAQTPQGFPRAMLEAAYQEPSADAGPTDDAALVEHAGYPVDIVPDRPSNLKITTAEDFDLAARLSQ